MYEYERCPPTKSVVGVTRLLLPPYSLAHELCARKSWKRSIHVVSCKGQLSITLGKTHCCTTHENDKSSLLDELMLSPSMSDKLLLSLSEKKLAMKIRGNLAFALLIMSSEIVHVHVSKRCRDDWRLQMQRLREENDDKKRSMNETGFNAFFVL